MAGLTATVSATIGYDGQGIAVVAEEARAMANKVNGIVEKAMFEGAEIDRDALIDLATQSNLLALNNAIESHNIGERGKSAAVCADEIRCLSREIQCLLGSDAAEKEKQAVAPWAANPLTTASERACYILLNIGGIPIIENLSNVREISMFNKYTEKNIDLRGMELPLADGFKLLGKTQETPTFVMIRTPWAEQNKVYAVAADVHYLFYSPAGKTIAPPADMPLAKYVRECWENENGEPFYFMDWTKMS